MRYKLLAALVFISCGLQAQQVNPVPDYVFQNRMSVGRTTVTDTLAYFSMGPRYGAIRGFMPPMVVDTALVTGGTKRNGLTIFSIQKNKYVYWDSVGSKWAEMAGTGGSAITGTGAAGYMPEFTTSTNLDSTTLYHSAGRFAIGSTTTSNGVFNVYGGQAYFDTSLKVGTQTLLADEGKNELYVNTTSDAGAYALQVAGSIYNTTGAVLAASSGEVYFGGTTDQGAYIIQAYGGLYNTGSVILSATSGIVGVGGAGSSVGTGYSTVDARGANTTNTGAFRVSSSDYSRDAQWYMLSGNMFFGTVSNHDIIFTTNATNQLRLTNGGDFGVGTMSPTYKLDVSGTIRTTTTLTTGAPTSGTAKPWRLGEAATVSPTSPNRTIRVEIDGTVYYIHAKTTND